ncbi:hypothetical protein BJY52DRAFT_1238912 [Lactarius psammicola]|nr:hypothetical protein BJY52DRAFT_1238912 [Lactarius psammicola]
MWLFRATADELLKEYKACESPDYISYVRALLVLFQAGYMRYPQGSNDGEQARYLPLTNVFPH